MKIFIILISAILILVSFALPGVITLDKQGAFGLGIMIGYNSIGGEWVRETFKGGLSIGVKTSINFTSHLSIISFVDYIRLRPTREADNKAQGDMTLRIWSFHAGLRLDFLSAREFIPFVESTIGFYHNRFRGVVHDENRNTWGFEARGGVEFFLNKRWTFTLSAGVDYYFKRFDEGDLNLIGDGGKAIFFPLRLSVGYYF